MESGKIGAAAQPLLRIAPRRQSAGSRSAPVRRTAGALGIALGCGLAAIGLSACGLAGMQADLTSFVASGVAIVGVRSVDLYEGGNARAYAPVGALVESRIALINPQRFAIEHTLTWDVGDECFGVLPTIADDAADPTAMTISFAFSPAAEHRTVNFSLVNRVAAINRTYEAAKFTLTCASPPNPAPTVQAWEGAGIRADLAFELPDGPGDSDITGAELSWRRADDPAVAGAATLACAELTALPADYPLGPASPLRRCYPSGLDASYAWEFSLVLVDALGQRSTAVAATSPRHVYNLNFASTGGDGGQAPAALSGYLGDALPLPSCGTLYRTGWAFVGWTADGGATTYRAADSYTLGAADATLSPVWIQNGTIISFDVGAAGLEFGSAPVSVARGDLLTVACGNAALASGGTAWRWYVDGVLEAGAAGRSFVWDTAGRQPRQYAVSCLVEYSGRLYSGSFRVTVTY
jgi:hypothetical protein